MPRVPWRLPLLPHHLPEPSPALLAQQLRTSRWIRDHRLAEPLKPHTSSLCFYFKKDKEERLLTTFTHSSTSVAFWFLISHQATSHKHTHAVSHTHVAVWSPVDEEVTPNFNNSKIKKKDFSSLRFEHSVFLNYVAASFGGVLPYVPVVILDFSPLQLN
jgi:hypothetical protein